jgi:hypothetical protein
MQLPRESRLRIEEVTSFFCWLLHGSACALFMAASFLVISGLVDKSMICTALCRHTDPGPSFAMPRQDNHQCPEKAHSTLCRWPFCVVSVSHRWNSPALDQLWRPSKGYLFPFLSCSFGDGKSTSRDAIQNECCNLGASQERVHWQGLLNVSPAMQEARQLGGTDV